MKHKTFRSRISILMTGLILAAMFYPIITTFLHRGYYGFYTLGGVSLFILIFCGIRYIISGEKLYLKMWFIPNGSANIKDIVSIERSYNILSAPAISLKRLSIRFKKGSPNIWWLISPVREKEFIDMLKTVNPNIEVNIPEKKEIWRFWDWDI